ncbi:glutamyl-tRNA(Gln) amidotransferase subunit B, mitochondrial isoform X2 [Homalodisca vitripennis]|uniref:glutamyl-tRNA(Gln) amidotransferase subunit B, mitochondrial isoform X2 n=1 Tax=Homalodisca vitripennis TaxID=197043 RepID=UPI001EEAE07E|nr:glutamyl-tRNA(Gln) amidotransferase subunit B, mitochondrial isoform X2 [Homalodisca vitripennis]
MSSTSLQGLIRCVLNRSCVEAGVLTALALNCTLNPVSTFDRKHYFYADLPAGYQITQQRCPLARGGEVQFQIYTPGVHKEPYLRKVQIHQLQLEQDSGKSLHDPANNRSLIDLNRAGVPLMEIVFEPDLSNGEEAAALVKELILILTSLNTCLCKMEEGGLRVDANVSVHRRGTPLGVRSEVKNIGSIRSVARAVDYEIQRQITLLQGGGQVINETRAWDPEHNCTVSMRDKEEKQDYRFMPEPNLPPLHLDMEGTQAHPDMVDVAALADKLPELPNQTRARLQADCGLSPLLAVRLVNEPELLRMFEAVLDESSDCSPTIVANLLVMELLTLVNKELCSLGSSRPFSKDIGEIADLLQSKRINLLTARHVLEVIASGDNRAASDIISAGNLWLVTDPVEIQAVCDAAILRNPGLVESYRSGKTKVLGALLGDIAKVTQNRVDMSLIARHLQELLKKPQ